GPLLLPLLLPLRPRHRRLVLGGLEPAERRAAERLLHLRAAQQALLVAELRGAVAQDGDRERLAGLVAGAEGQEALHLLVSERAAADPAEHGLLVAALVDGAVAVDAVGDRQRRGAGGVERDPARVG